MTSVRLILVASVLFLIVARYDGHLIPPKVPVLQNRQQGLTEDLVSCGDSFCDPQFCKKVNENGENSHSHSQFSCQVAD